MHDAKTNVAFTPLTLVAMSLQPLCLGLSAKSSVKSYFADKPGYERFYTELTGTVQIFLKAFDK